MENKKIFYFFIGCICLSLILISVTYAYFMTRVTDNGTVAGNTGRGLTTFGLNIERVTTGDLVSGLIPMKNELSPNAATQKCTDDLGRAGCQIYKITVDVDSDTSVSVTGFIATNKKDGVETRYTRVYTDDGENFYTDYTTEDFDEGDFDVGKFIKTGNRVNLEDGRLNPIDDYQALLVDNDTFESDSNTKDYYVMIWIYESGKEQNELQGIQDAFTGEAIFYTNAGNRIKATFD